MNRDSGASRTSRGRQWAALGAAICTVLTVWTIVLPSVSSWDAVHSRIEFLKAQGVDPAAVYYTDIEAMNQIEQHVNEAMENHPQAFWSIRVTP